MTWWRGGIHKDCLRRRRRSKCGIYFLTHSLQRNLKMVGSTVKEFVIEISWTTGAQIFVMVGYEMHGDLKMSK